ncbi:5'-methylthioadenosine/adenosylhomocysteine nucleosidase [Deinococcus roseus]|nr:5'-methylthioadenosine/adenosylhomocysteine nucleosidase [Deinococcus roseus]
MTVSSTSQPFLSGTLGIIGAMDEEIHQLTADLLDGHTFSHQGSTFHQGKLFGQQVTITKCGIGKVNAAMTTQALLSLGVQKIIFTGVAGGVTPGLQVGDIVISTDLLQHDVDVTPLGYQIGLIPDEELSWTADAELQELALESARQIDGIHAISGRIASGDQFIASKDKVRWLYDTFQVAAAEMEGAAVAQVASKWGIPFVVIRSLSDTADGEANVDYRSFMPLVAIRAKSVVRGMLQRM